jgi:hypothetical protein
MSVIIAAVISKIKLNIINKKLVKKYKIRRTEAFNKTTENKN